MNDKHKQVIEELRAMGYAVAILSPQQLGMVAKEDAEEWMLEAIDTCREINEEENGGGRYAD